MNVVEWTNTAEDDYLTLLKAEYENSTSLGIALYERMETLVDNLRQFKHLCPATERFPKFRRCVVTRYLSIVYEVGEHSVTIISVFDSRKDSPFT